MSVLYNIIYVYAKKGFSAGNVAGCGDLVIECLDQLELLSALCVFLQTIYNVFAFRLRP